MNPKIIVSTLSVMKSCCKTCPFKPNEKGHWQNVELANEVIGRNLLASQQICHGTEGKNRQPHHRCKGYYDYAAEIYKRMGVPVPSPDAVRDLT